MPSWPWAVLLLLFLLSPGPCRAQEPSGEHSGNRWKTWLHWTPGAPGHRVEFFPRGDIFSPPVADQRQPRFHATWQAYHTDFGSYRVGSVGFGENIGLFRWAGAREGDGTQFGISGAAFSIFNLDSPSYDLLNTDYVIGFPLSVRKGRWSGRARVFHQSSHLGDEFLLNSQPIAVKRLNLSFEELEVLGSYDEGSWRIYGGGSRILSTLTPLRRYRAQGGLEYRSHPFAPLNGRFIAGASLSGWQETEWSGDVSVKAGLQFESPYQEARFMRLLGEFYNGHIPHGQFYQIRTRYLGFGISFAL